MQLIVIKMRWLILFVSLNCFGQLPVVPSTYSSGNIYAYCTPNAPLSGLIASYDVLCPTSIILNSTNTSAGPAILTWKNLSGVPNWDITNSIEDYINVSLGTAWITNPVYHASGSLNSNSTPNIYFQNQWNANHTVTVLVSLESGAGTNIPQPFTVLCVFQPFAQTNGNATWSVANFNGTLGGSGGTQDSITFNSTPNSTFQLFQGAGLTGNSNFGTNWTILTSRRKPSGA